ncbi:MAG TPA: hypothetical protein VG937_05275 [Polyangiaceae bacterium]|nr:hypothetical protein [Polyangiaceae bacterium]
MSESSDSAGTGELAGSGVALSAGAIVGAGVAVAAGAIVGNVRAFAGSARGAVATVRELAARCCAIVNAVPTAAITVIRATSEVRARVLFECRAARTCNAWPASLAGGGSARCCSTCCARGGGALGSVLTAGSAAVGLEPTDTGASRSTTLSTVRCGNLAGRREEGGGGGTCLSSKLGALGGAAEMELGLGGLGGGATFIGPEGRSLGRGGRGGAGARDTGCSPDTVRFGGAGGPSGAV